MQEIISQITDAYDDAVSDLSIEEAIEVAEAVEGFISAALAGLREDLGES